MSIQVKELTHIYSEGLPHQSIALDGVSFSVDDGQFAGIIGHTGSGKSTLVQHLNGLLKPKSGSVRIGDVEITGAKISMGGIRRKVGLVFQYPEYQLFEETVYKDVAFGPSNLSLTQEEIALRVREALDLVGLDYDTFAQRSPFELSGGQKRRVAIAGVIAMKPEILILDEPTAGLDPKAHKDVLDMIKSIHRNEGNITLLISHNMSDIAQLADKVLVMDHGKLILSGTPEEVFGQRDLLNSIGLSVPPVTEFMNQLCEAGFPVSVNALSVPQAASEIMRVLETGVREGGRS